VVVFSGQETKGLSASNVSPNPFTNEISLTVTLNEATSVNLQIVDLAGRMVATKKIAGKIGQNLIRFNDLAPLAPGIYFLRIVTPNASLQQKIVKARY
jgi:hypothetical protein